MKAVGRLQIRFRINDHVLGHTNGEGSLLGHTGTATRDRMVRFSRTRLALSLQGGNVPR